jgi:hypothetical protein
MSLFSKEELKAIFDSTMQTLMEEAKSPEELISIWINIGTKLGVDFYFPHLKVVVHSDEDGTKEMVALVGSPSEEIVEFFSSEEVMTDEIIDIVLKEIKDTRGVYH